MTTALRTSGKQGALLIAGILMIATTLRVTFTGAAPLLDTIRLDYGLSTAQTGLLTTLPLLAFALVSPLAAGAGPAYRHGAQPVYRPDADLHRDCGSLPAFRYPAFHRNGGDWLRDRAGECAAARLN